MSTYVIGTHDVGNCFHDIIPVICFSNVSWLSGSGQFMVSSMYSITKSMNCAHNFVIVKVM